MADEKPLLHIDNDWKKQAQEEKKKLVEQEQQKAASAAAKPEASPVIAAPSAGAPVAPGAGSTGPARDRGQRGRREVPPASVATLVQSIMAQVFYYLGDMPQANEASVNLDVAKHQIDTLGVLEEKTANNLTPEEQLFLDTALYETRTRFVAVASQYI